MVCVYCNAPTNVINSRLQKRLNQVWRRRSCDSCGAVVTTHETVDWFGAVSIKTPSGTLQPFSRDNLFISLYESCKHRSTALTDANQLLATILAELRTEIHDGVLHRNEIIKVAFRVLGRVDAAAATMYAAYHPTSNS